MIPGLYAREWFNETSRNTSPGRKSLFFSQLTMCPKDLRCALDGRLCTESLGESDLGVSKNRGTPKWMVKIMENPIKIDLGVPPFKETPIWRRESFLICGPLE